MSKKYVTSKDIKIEKLRAIAPTCYTLMEALELSAIPQTTFKTWCKSNEALNSEIKSLLKRVISVRKQTVSTGDTELTFTYQDVRNQKNYKEDEKRKFVDMICYAIENGVQVSSACKAFDVSQSTFFRWVSPTSNQSFPYAVEKYAESSSLIRFMSNEIDVFNARMILQSKLEERKVTNTTLHYETRGVNGEQEILKGKTVHERTVEPELAAVALVLNNLDSDFNKKAINQALIDTEEFAHMTADMLREEIEKERARKQLLDSGEYEY